MVYKLAKEYPEMFQAYVAICANLPIKENNDCCDEQKAVNMMIVNGTADKINPYNGGEVLVDDDANRGEVVSTQHTLQQWKDLLGQESIVETKEIMKKYEEKDDTQVVIYGYRSIELLKKVVLVKIENGGHVIPNPYFSNWPKELGSVNRDINLPKYILDFFAL
ncbi:POLY(3-HYDROXYBUTYRATE) DEPOLYMERASE [hydrothermal vent metagenome]|uniref:POLY(3-HYDROXYBUTYRATE) DEPOLYMERASE n=1 Tax=hydrothermal vent metagenome TaxID=652676 RepID=A0A1W1EEH0_9ZZZZ